MPLPTLPRLTLVLGGARSGKSRYAEELVSALNPPWIYVATASAHDDEMRERIAAHQLRRDSRWSTVDAPVELAAAVRELGARGQGVLIDCFTLWLSNVMLAGRDVRQEIDLLVDALADASGPIVAVSNEVGLGIVPDNALARAFRDAQGRLNENIAAMADQVVFIAAGLPLVLKSQSPKGSTSA